jgi:ribosomal protein L29
MAIILAKQLREKTDGELTAQMNLERQRIFQNTMKGSSGESVKPNEKRDGKRLIARIQTILRERARRKELGAQIKKLEGQTKGASPAVEKLLKKTPNPQQPRVRTRNLRLKQAVVADHAGVKLAEARRLTAALKRDDPGVTK